MLHNGHPSEVMPLQWPEPESPLPAGAPFPPGYCQIGFSMESISTGFNSFLSLSCNSMSEFDKLMSWDQIKGS